MFVVLALSHTARAQDSGTPAQAVATAMDASALGARGVVGSIEITYAGGGLRAKAVRDAAAPMLVRVVPLGDSSPDRFRVEYLGLVSGEYDLATLIERDDGRPATGLAPIVVRVHSQLPAQHGTDVFGLSSSRLWLGAHYRVLMGVLAAAWVLVPIVFVVRRLMRRERREIPVLPPREPTPAELLGELINVASTRELSGSERGRLELLLFRVLREQEPGVAGSPGELAAAIARLRNEPRTANIVRSVERWLHAREDASPEGPSGSAAAAITELRALAQGGAVEGGAR